MGWISSRVGMRMTTPLRASLSNESQSGTARLAALSRFLVGQLPRGIGILDLNDVVDLEAEGRNVDLAAVDLHVAMGHQLPGGRARIGEAEMISDIVQPGLQDLQHLLAGNSTAPESAFVNAPELALEQAVVIAELLFLNQTQTVIGVLATRLRAMHAGAVIAPLEVFRRAKDRNTEAAADANAGTSITSHLSKVGS